jgi:hypothetical protein
MAEKSWEDMSIDEKVSEVRRIIKDFIAHSDKNLATTAAAINGLNHRLMGIEADLGQLKRDVAALGGKPASP